MIIFSFNGSLFKGFYSDRSDCLNTVAIDIIITRLRQIQPNIGTAFYFFGVVQVFIQRL